MLAVAIGVIAALPASSALAVNSTQKFAASASPNKGGTKAKPLAVTLKVRPYFGDVTPDAAAPFATDKANVFFPAQAVFNGKDFPSCPAAKVLTNSASCPAGSKVGSGTAKGEALGLIENLKVTIFNGTGGKGVELLVVGSTPLVINSVITGKLIKQTGKYGYKLVVDVPPDLEQPAPGAIATLTDFDTTLPKRTRKKNGKVIPYIGNSGCPKNGKWNFGYVGQFTDGTEQKVETTQACRK